MPANTPNRNYTYATSGDANDLALISQRLAEQIDTDVAGVITNRDAGLSTYGSLIIGGASPVTLGNGIYSMKYRKQGRRVKCFVTFVRGSTTSFPSAGTIAIPVPFPVADMGNGAVIMPLGTYRMAASSVAMHGMVVHNAPFSGNAVYLIVGIKTGGAGFDTFTATTDLSVTGTQLAGSFEYETTTP